MAVEDLKSDTADLIEKDATIFDRLGGAINVTMMLDAFFDEFVETPELRQFFFTAPTQVMKDHQLFLSARLVLKNCAPVRMI